MARPARPAVAGGRHADADRIRGHRADGCRPAAAVLGAGVRHRAVPAQRFRPADPAGADGPVAGDVDPLHVLAAHRDARLRQHHRPGAGHGPGGRGDLRLRGAGAGVFPGGLAAQPCAGAAAGGPRAVADRGRVHSHLQRTVVGGAYHRTGRHRAGLAGRQAARAPARRRPPRGVPRVLRAGGRELCHPHEQQPCQGRQHQCRAEEDRRRVRGRVRLRSRAHPLVPADVGRWLPARCETRGGADPALFLLAGPVRAQPGHLRSCTQRG